MDSFTVNYNARALYSAQVRNRLMWLAMSAALFCASCKSAPPAPEAGRASEYAVRQDDS